MRLPAEDRELSPYTGWTREHWEQTADDLLRGVRRFASQGRGLIHLPGRQGISGRRSDGLEGFARTFLLAAFRIRGAEGVGVGEHIDFYAHGLAAGSSSESEDAWPAIEDLSQPAVEASSIAIALFETRPWIWDALDQSVQERVIQWLSGIHGKRLHPNNWLLFAVMVNSFLKSVGAPFRQDEIERNLDAIDSMYRGDGWYSDGYGNNFDHYVGWAMHLYTNLWSRMDGDKSDPARAGKYRGRLTRFLGDYRCLFGADGSPLHQGRSLIYRFAAIAPVWAGALVNATPMTAGETRRLASGAIRHFLDRGAISEGILTMGWHGEFIPMAQIYSGPASPYWASKGFMGLLLPAGHPVWTEREEPMESERHPGSIRAMPVPGFLAHAADGVVQVANHRSDRFPWSAKWGADPHYRKLAYSTHTAPETGPEGDASDIDGQVVLMHAGDAPRRRRIHYLAVGDHFGASVHYPFEHEVSADRWMPRWDHRIETVTIALGAAQLHIHHVIAASGAPVCVGGFAVADGDRPALETSNDAEKPWCIAAVSAGLSSAIFGLHGFDRAGAQELEGNNAFGRFSATPWVATAEGSAEERVVVSLLVLGKGDPFAQRERLAELEVSGRQVTVTCTDRTVYLVNLVELEEGIRFARVDPDGSRTVVG